MNALMKRMLVLIALVGLAVPAAAQIGPGPFAAFPTESETDGRMLSFGCAGIATFEQRVRLTVGAGPGETEFTISLFDGDTGRQDTAGKDHWDVGTRQLAYRLYFDPFRTGNSNPADLVGEWFGNDLAIPLTNPVADPEKQWTASAANMPDNDWWGVTVQVSSLAQAPSGHYFYQLVIETDGACGATENLASDLKIAGDAPLTFLVPRFGFEASLRSILNDGPIIYQPFSFTNPLGSATTYDGTFDFFLNIEEVDIDLRLIDGDFDHGVNAGQTVAVPSGVALPACGDSDDPDTDAAYTGFPFVTTGAAPESAVAVNVPPDDVRFDLARRGEPGDPNRTGCVRYDLIDPSGTVYANPNPSGNLEWEQFRIAAQLAPDPTNSDFQVASPTLPSGVWTVRIFGLDLANLNFWFFESGACGNREGQPACPGPVFILGDTVFFDANGNGVQDSGEPGIPGVVVNLYRDTNLPAIKTAVTGDPSNPNWQDCLNHNTGLDTDGLYCFGVNTPGDYTVEIAAENFLPGGALFDLVSTTGGEVQAGTVVDDNLLDFDYGYLALGSIGDRVWRDDDGDGFQDGGEPGINGVTVILRDGSGNVVATAVTSGDGNYLFPDLFPGTYTVEVDASTLPAGLAQTFDLDGLATPHTATLTLAAGEDRRDADFGYGPCAACQGKVSSLTLAYLGGSGGFVEVFGRRGPIKNDPLFAGSVAPGGSFTVVGPPTGTGGFVGTLGTEISLYVDGVLNTKIHTSCSQPIGPGLVSGDFLVLAGASKHGGLLCSLGDGGGGGGEPPPQAPGTGTIGYWKNHPEAWPADEVTIGGIPYTRNIAIALMGAKSGGDKTYDLFKQLVAAVLNVLVGNESSCVDGTIAAAQAWMGAHPVGSGVKSKDSAWKNEGGALHQTLDDYNNGELCAPHRD